MADPFQVLEHEGELNETVRAAFIETYGNRGGVAVNAVIDGHVKKYLDFFVVVGNHDDYCVENEFCTCAASKYGSKCWHTLAVQIAEKIQAYEEYDFWYYTYLKRAE